MIFLTVGHQVPFDRLVRLVDDWAGSAPGRQIFAQIGETDFRPANMEFAKYLNRAEFDVQLDRCTHVVAHAGVGTIIQALLKRKPLLVLTRLSRYRETRSDHQVGTARHFADQGQLLAAFEDAEFVTLLDRLSDFTPPSHVRPHASPQLLTRIRDFIGEPSP
jgi:UDP-N-acetylglucosamine transferase subunit ALG13